MSKAREIAEERLARGEITREEFDAIISRLGPSRVPLPPPAPSNVTPIRTGGTPRPALGLVADGGGQGPQDPLSEEILREFKKIEDAHTEGLVAKMNATAARVAQAEADAARQAEKMIGGHIGAGFAIATVLFFAGNLLARLLIDDPARRTQILEWILTINPPRQVSDIVWAQMALYTVGVVVLGMLISRILGGMRARQLSGELNRLTAPRLVLIRLPSEMQKVMWRVTRSQYVLQRPKDLDGKVEPGHVRVRYNPVLPILAVLGVYWLMGVYRID